MRLAASDPDIETIVARIQRNEIDLQPDFQRGEVWSQSKKRKLIDTILREWHIPPIHIIEIKGTSQLEVLDGQQRLVSIRDFVKGSIKVDGTIEPHDENLANLDGRTYAELPDEWRKRFNRFSIRVFTITDYNPDEPGELFYRLNQPTHLTAAEQRNAFFGAARQQVKELSQALINVYKIDKSFTGFSNSRMAYDDVIARFCYTLEKATLREKITAKVLADRYRSKLSFPEPVVSRADMVLKTLSNSKPYVGTEIRLTKATLYSWLCFISQLINEIDTDYPDLLGKYLTYFESYRSDPKRSLNMLFSLNDETFHFSPQFKNELIGIYNDRSSAHVSDVSSVVSRDVVIWLLFTEFASSYGNSEILEHPKIVEITNYLQERNQDESTEYFIERFLTLYNWGYL